jgi:hypothetical protein
MLLMALLLVAGCGDPFATPGYSMAGTWTVLETFVFEDQTISLVVSCAGPTTATFKEDNSGNITGTIEGVVPCISADGARALNYTRRANMHGGQDDRDFTLWGGVGTDCWTLHGTMTTPTTAEGTMILTCGWVSAHGTWSATRN